VSDPADDLRAFLAGDPPLTGEDAREAGHWQVNDDRHAQRLLRKLALLRSEAARIKQAADDEIALVESWRDIALAGLHPDIASLEGALGDYWRRQLEEQLAELMATGLTRDEAWAKLRVKSRKLPGGTLVARRTPGGREITDPDLFVAWAETHGRTDLLRLAPAKKAIDTAEDLNTAGTVIVAVGGEIVPGLAVRPPEERFSVST
jgi:phage host-nuclease inhibitor protein Gam